MHPFWSAPEFILRRKVSLGGRQFRITDPGGRLIAFVEKKLFRLKEDIRIYGDEQKSQEILVIQARQIMDFAAAYDIYDPVARQKVGALRRKGWNSIIRDEWEVLDANDFPVGKLHEDSLQLALIRRLLLALIPQNFDLVDVAGTKLVDLKQQFNPFLYTLNIDFRPDGAGRVDRRVGIAAAVLMASIEGRQEGGLLS